MSIEIKKYSFSKANENLEIMYWDEMHKQEFQKCLLNTIFTEYDNDCNVTIHCVVVYSVGTPVKYTDHADIIINNQRVKLTAINEEYNVAFAVIKEILANYF